MTEQRYALDASALLALLGREPGSEAVAMCLAVGVVSAVNWAEVLQKAHAHHVDVDGLREDLESLGVEFVSFDGAEAIVAADLWHRGCAHLALADRACLATAAVRDCVAVTADRAWAALDIGVDVELIR